MKISSLFIVILLGLALFGCINTGEPLKKINFDKNSEPKLDSSAAGGRPALNLLDLPKKVETETDSADVELKYSSYGLTIVPPSSKNQVGQGHFHISIDGNADIEVMGETYTVKDLSLGKHKIKIEVVQNDHSSFFPNIAEYYDFEVVKVKNINQPKTYEVTINDFSFSPEKITIAKGDTVLWKNNAQFPRTVVSDVGLFSSVFIPPYGSYSFKFEESGEYNYTHALYPSMKGTVVVK